MTVNLYTREILRFLIAEGRNFPLIVSVHSDEFVKPLLTMFDHILHKGVREGVFEIWAEDHLSQILISPALAFAIVTLLGADSNLPELKVYVNTHYEMIMRSIRKRQI
jgi:hypothetical protein